MRVVVLGRLVVNGPQSKLAGGGLSLVTEHTEFFLCSLAKDCNSIPRISEILSCRRPLASSTSNLILSFYG